MSRYIGNYLRVPSLEPQQSSAPGVWSISEQLNYQRANQWPPARDPYYNQTVLHLSGDVAGTRETNPVTQPRTFLSDASTNNFLLTPNGDVSARSFNPYMGSNYSTYFDGIDDALTVAGNAALDLTGDFTIEFWANMQGNTNYLCNGTQSGSGCWRLIVTASTGTAQFDMAIGSWAGLNLTSAAGLFTKNVWTHFAITRSASTFRLFINGVPVAIATNSGSLVNTGRATQIGYYTESSGTYYSQWYLSNLRIIKGTALYTTGFTPSSIPLTAITNTSLLTCQSNRLIDTSSNNFTVTPSSTPAVTQNSPFVEYDTTSGSGYFDGTGDYLEGNNLSSFNFLHSPSALFTVQCWVYISSVISSGSRTIIATTPNSGGIGTNWTLEYYNSAVYMNLFITRGVGGVWVISGYSTSAFTTYNQWTHLAVTYDQSLASNNATFYINGQPVGTASKLANAPSSSNASYPLHIGRVPTASIDFNGYIADLHISNSILPITVPTIPQKLTSSTQLLTLQTRAPANNQGILDTSPNNFVVTRTGNVAQGSFSPFSASGYSVSTTATNTLDLPGSVLAFGSSSFTLEAWVYATHVSGAPIVYPYNSGNAVTSGGFSVSFGTGGVGYYAVNGATPINYSAAIPLNTWYHLALVKDGSAARLYLNGQLVATGTDSTTYTTPTGGARVGGIYNLTQTYGLVVNNLRIVTGQALYNANFTPATTNLTASVIGHQGLENTAITGTVRILTARDPYRIDRSSNNHTIGSSGSPQFLPISPFAPTQAYVASQLGGSAYFDASGDSVALTSSIVNPSGTEDFTLEFWFYHAMSSWPGGFLYYINGTGSGTFGIYYNNVQNEIVVQQSGVTQIITTAVSNTPLNQWNHYALVRSSNSWAVWINGRRTNGPITNSTSFNAATGFSISPTNTYISGFRIVKQPLYLTSQSTIPVPTAPPQAVNNTTTLLNFTGAGIVDSTGRNNLETVGNSAVQTSVIKYGSGSMSFDGTGDYLFEPHSTLYEFGSGDFTIEFWARANSLSGAYTGVVGVWFAGNTVTANSWYVSLNGYNATNKFGFSYTQSNTSYELIFNATTSTGSWDHYAIVRSGGTLYGFKNGASQTLSSGSSTISGAINNGTSGLYVGTTGTDGGGTAFNGYISNLRITKYARYTSNFTTNLPPGPFPLA